MRSLNDYIDLAKARHHYPSDRQLAIALNIRTSALSGWRKLHNFPTDTNMVALAELAGVASDTALLDLNVWRAATAGENRAVAVYEALIKKLAAAAVIALGIFSSDAALGFVVNGMHSHCTTQVPKLYIMRS